MPGSNMNFYVAEPLDRFRQKAATNHSSFSVCAKCIIIIIIIIILQYWGLN
jgi:hypothetical protein